MEALLLVGKGGIMKRQYHKPLNNASQTYESKRHVTIVFRESPFFGEIGLILKETLGGHSDLRLELSSGKRIRIDAAWTDYFRIEFPQNPKPTSQCIDFAQAQSIIRFIEYLREKQETSASDPLRTNA
jgi:hypothetical protein